MTARVGHVTPWGVHCGIAKHLSYWLPFAAARRPQFVLAEYPPWWHTAVMDWNTCGSIRCWKRSHPDNLKIPCRVALEQGINILHWQWDPSFFPWEAIKEYEAWAQAAGVKTVATIHTLHEEDEFTWVTKAVLGAVDIVAAGTPGLVDALTAYAGRFAIPLKSAIRYVPLPVPAPPALNRVAQPPSAVKGPVILTWGFLGTGKGHLAILDAVRRIRRDYAPGAVYRVAGRAMTGEQKNNVDTLLKAANGCPGLLDLQERWFSDEEIAALCREADVIALNHVYQHQSSSGTVALSVASGTPVVVSDSPMFSGYAEADAVKVAQDGPDGFHDALLDVLTKPDQLDAGREWMMRRIAAPTVADQYESIYQELCP